MTQLPFVDEIAVEIAADRERVWRALMRSLGGSSPIVTRAAALLGVADRRVEGELEQPGSTIVGFRVVRAERPVELALAGRHRFARYSLTFAIDELGGARTRLRAITRAEFPGARGRVYRALVIGTRGHVVAVRLMLARVRKRVRTPTN